MEINWNILIATLKSTLEDLKHRDLSYKGKVLVLNTIALAMIWYVATVIPMTPDHETKIKILIFKFLWRVYGGDDPPRPTISCDMSYQPKDKGGLSVKAPLQQQMALQLKFIKNFTDITDHSQWLILPRYWLGFYLRPLQPEWNFLINSGPTLQEPLLREIRHTVRWEFD